MTNKQATRAIVRAILLAGAEITSAISNSKFNMDAIERAVDETILCAYKDIYREAHPE